VKYSRVGDVAGSSHLGAGRTYVHLIVNGCFAFVILFAQLQWARLGVRVAGVRTLERVWSFEAHVGNQLMTDDKELGREPETKDSPL
jgi:hypothetical protein